MAVICPRYRLLYLEVPATGCSVVAQFLRNELTGHSLGRRHADVAELIRTEKITEEELHEYLVLANIRNPFDRLVSYYQRLNGPWNEEFAEWKQRDLERQASLGELSSEELRASRRAFERFMERRRRRARLIGRLGFNAWVQLTVLRWRFGRARRSLFPMLDRVDVALRQEELESGLEAVLRQVGYSGSIRLEVRNTTAGKRFYRDYYTGFSQRLISMLYRHELKRFGYTFEGFVDGQTIVPLSERVAR